MNKLFFPALLGVFLLISQDSARAFNLLQFFQKVGRTIETPFAEAIGESVKASMIAEHGRWNDKYQVDRVNRIGQAVTANCPRGDVNYRFTVLDWDTVNAFAAPAGQIFVTKGMLLKSDDNELAGVIAHEAGHVIRNHSMKALERNIGFMVLMNKYIKDQKLTQAQWATLGTVLLQLHQSRAAEFEADQIAVQLTHKSGYSPRGIISFFEKLMENEKNSKEPPFLYGLNKITSTHPPTKDRISRAYTEITKLQGD